MQKPADIEFRTRAWSRISAELEDQRELVIQVRLEEGKFVQTLCKLRGKPNGKTVEDVFPPEYQLGGAKQHPAYAKLIHPLGVMMVLVTIHTVVSTIVETGRGLTCQNHFQQSFAPR